jgi:rhamnosyltransferase
MNKPRIAVLLAAWNGERFIGEQIQSILRQVDVEVGLFVSDDGSADSTVRLVDEMIANGADVVMLPVRGRLGSAAANFFRLIMECDVAGFEYFALADQDDVWDSDKLIRAVDVLRRERVSGYSGPVTAFWPSGEKRFIQKHPAQREFDYFFESPGPGCTFVMDAPLFHEVRRAVLRQAHVLREVHYHDWYIYAFARSHGFKWCIDSVPKMLYRQHGANDTGANSGVMAAWVRVKKIWSGWAAQQAYLIADICGYGGIMRQKFDYKPGRVMAVLCSIGEFRRSTSGRAALGIFVALGKMRPRDCFRR